MRMKFISALVLLLFTTASIPFVIGERDAPEGPLAGEPDIRIEFDQPKYSVNVEPGDDGVIRVTGTIYCDIPPATPPGQFCIVNLMADAGGWPVSVPPSFSFDRTHQEEDFTVDVQVPIETSTSTTGQLSVSGRWSYSPGVGGGTIPASTAIIIVQPYSRIAISFDKDNNTASVGSWGEIEITITNEGNANDDVSLKIMDLPDGMEAYLNEDLITVQEKHTKTTILNFKQKSGSPGTHTIYISAEGQYNGTRSKVQQSIVIETKASLRSIITTPFIVIPLIIILIIAGVVLFKFVKKKRS